MAEAPATPPDTAKKDAPQQSGAPASADAAGAPASEGDAKPSFVQKLKLKLGGATKLAKGAGGSAAAIPGKVFGGIWAIVKGILGIPFAIFKGDLSDKLIAVGFLASIALAGFSGLHIYRYLLKKLENRKPAPVAEKVDGRKDFLSDQKDLAKLAANVFMLERFSASLKSNTARVGGYELELFVESDSVETSEILKRRLSAIRDSIGGMIQNRVYEELLTEEGKEKLKTDLLNTINEEVRKGGGAGKVKRVYFSRFVMG